MRWIAVIGVLIICIVMLGVSHAQQTEPAEADATPQPAKSEASAKPSQPGKPYTSVIINAAGLSLERDIDPKILRENGSLLWGDNDTTTEFAIEHGVAAYARSIEDAEKNKRSGENPLIIKAIKCVGDAVKSDVVISDADADLLLAEDKLGKFLDKFNVILVQDPLP
ncbi:MAG: hypothetical protein GX139_07870 [Armatimonadetes bacterium]|jgi:hypothetical protein|nr:hypothetical protein [Armatimonadota bacterium]